MQELTLALAIILCAGFAAAKLGQTLRLPSVTGYIVAGLLLGPSGLNIIPRDPSGANLEHFTQIALMLIAFGIGEHLELKRLQHTLYHVLCITLFESLTAFFLVSTGCYFFAVHSGLIGPAWSTSDLIILAMLLGTVSIATAPASTLHVIRETQAAGPMTSTLMQVVATNNGLAIISFGIVLSIARHMEGATAAASSLANVMISITDIFFSLGVGLVTGLAIDLIIGRLQRRSEMLTIGLALLLLGGEISRLFNLSPLLTGMMTGFIIVNRARRDVRLFRIINAFEPPVYVIFFTLAGAHLDLKMLTVAGWLGLIYFLFRAAGKAGGAAIGATVAKAASTIRHNIGLALMPQAGVAIGLVFLIQGAYPELKTFSEILTPVVLAGVLLAELAGPAAVRQAVTKAGETPDAIAPDTSATAGDQGQCLVPWTWPRLIPHKEPNGTIVIGAASPKTVGCLVRIATLLGHQLKAQPMAVRIVTGKHGLHDDIDLLFNKERFEAKQIGYELSNRVVRAESIATGLIAAAMQEKARAIVLGHPLGNQAQDFQQVVDGVARSAPCPVILVRLSGILHTERILVPFTSTAELPALLNLLKALTTVGRHRITLLRLLPSETDEEESSHCERRTLDWALQNSLGSCAFCRAVATEARMESILLEAEHHDIIVMVAGKQSGLQRLFFGSLASDIALRCQKPMILIHEPRSER